MLNQAVRTHPPWVSVCKMVAMADLTRSRSTASSDQRENDEMITITSIPNVPTPLHHYPHLTSPLHTPQFISTHTSLHHHPTLITTHTSLHHYLSPDNRSCVRMSDTLVVRNESFEPLHISGNVLMACLRI